MRDPTHVLSRQEPIHVLTACTCLERSPHTNPSVACTQSRIRIPPHAYAYGDKAVWVCCAEATHVRTYPRTHILAYRHSSLVLDGVDGDVRRMEHMLMFDAWRRWWLALGRPRLPRLLQRLCRTSCRLCSEELVWQGVDALVRCGGGVACVLCGLPGVGVTWRSLHAFR